MTKSRGRITLPEERQAVLRTMLMRHYEKNKGFLKDWIFHLYRYEPVLETLLRLKNRLPSVASHVRAESAWDALSLFIGWGPVPTTMGRKVRQSRHTHLRRYRQDLIDLCDRWGLRGKWAAPWLHASFLEWEDRIMPVDQLVAVFAQLPPGLQAALIGGGLRHGWAPAKSERGRFRRALQEIASESPPGHFPGGLPDISGDLGISPSRREKLRDAAWFHLRNVQFFGWFAGDPRIRIDTQILIDVPYDPWPVDNWKDVEKRIIAEAKTAIVPEARQQRDAVRAQYVQAGFSLQDTEPKLERNVRWLYERIALGMNPVAKMRALASGKGHPDDRRDYEESGEGFEFTYRDATSRLAREMDIRLR